MLSFLHKKNTQSGQAAIITVLFLVSLMLVVSAGFSSLALKQEKIVKTNFNGKQSYLLAEAGNEDAIYRIKTAKNISSEEVMTLGGSTATTTITDVGSDKDIVTEANVRKNIRKIKTLLSYSDEVEFFYGMQTGDGGVLMENSSTVVGNIYSNGPVEGFNSNVIKGEVVSAGPSGRIDGIRATSTAFAHTINDAFIEGDAHYQVITGTTVLGTLYPEASDPATSSMPISDELIGQWESDAEDGGTISSPCPYIINSDVTLGPVKITCDLEINGSPTITLLGNVWVVGNIDMQNTAVIVSDSSLGSNSVTIIADNPADQLTSSKIKLTNKANFFGTGLPGSYILLISQNRSSEQGGSEVAIDAGNSAEGDLLVYAPHGEILLRNKINLKEVTAYKIHLKNTAEVFYETGLASLLFTSGPGGGYNIQEWFEIE